MKYKSRKTEWNRPYYNTAAPNSSDLISRNQGRYYRAVITRVFSSEDPSGAEVQLMTATITSSRKENSLSDNLDVTSENALADSEKAVNITLSEVTVVPMVKLDEAPSVGDEVVVMLIDNQDTSIYDVDGYYVRTIEPATLTSKLAKYAASLFNKDGSTTPTNASGSAAEVAAKKYPTPYPNIPKTSVIPEGVIQEGQSEPSFPATSGKSENQKYDYYASKIESVSGSIQSGANKYNIVMMRKKSNFYDNAGRGIFDDAIAIIWIDSSGEKRVQEFIANGEAHASIQGKRWGQFKREEPVDKGGYNPALAEPGNHLYQIGTPGKVWKKYLRSSKGVNWYFGSPTKFPTDGEFTLYRTSGGKGTYSLLFHPGGKGMAGSAGCQTFPLAEFRRLWNTITEEGDPGKMPYTIIEE